MKILHFWPKSSHHIGDYFYARSQQKILRECFPGVEITEGPCTRHKPNGKGITESDLMQEGDAVIIGGGPLYYLIGDNGNLYFDEPALINCKKPIYVWSTGLEGHINADGNLLDKKVAQLKYIRTLHDCAKSSAVRDTATSDWLKSLGYDSRVTGDAVHFLTDIRPIKKRTGKILFAWRHDLCEPISRIILDYFDWLNNENIEFVVVCQSKGDKLSADKFGLNGFYSYKVEDYINLLPSIAAMLGFRMHMTILNLIQGVPSHCFYNSIRIKAWADDLFPSKKWILPMDNVNLDTLQLITEKLLSCDTKIFDHFTDRALRLKDKTYRWVKKIGGK